MRRSISLVSLLVVIAVLSLAACASEEASSTPSTEPTATEQEVMATPTTEAEMAATATEAPTPTVAAVTPESEDTSMTSTAVESIPPEIQAAQEEWPLANHDYANTRTAMNAAINGSNVDQLGVAWTFPIPGRATFGAAATNPLIAASTVYLQDLESNVFALNLEDGQVVWEQMFNEVVVGPNGPALGWDKVFAQGGLGMLRALDRESGEVVWTAELEGATGTHQPYAYDGFLYTAAAAGAVNQDPQTAYRGYAAGTSGFIYAVDQSNGEIVWQFQTVEDDFWGNPDINSGGGVWYPPAIDIDTGMTFWGTGNPAPFPGIVDFPNGTSRPGPNLYTASILAFDHTNGEMAWYQQVKPHDLFDLDFQVPRILAAAEVDGTQRDMVIGSGKLGRVIAFDRASGEILWDTEVGRHQKDQLEEIPLDEPVEVYPGILGGVETPMAFADGVIYAPVVNLATEHSANGWDAQDATEALNNANAHTNTSEGTSELVAIDVSTGEILWSTELEAPNFGAATVVNDLVFTALYDGTIHALSRQNGEIVWTTQAPAGINGWPAVAGDTIIFPAGAGEEPALVAYRLGAEGEIMAEPTATPEMAEPTATPEMAEPTEEPTEQPTEMPQEVEVQMINTTFEPPEITISPGTTVVWTNEDPFAHTVTSGTRDNPTDLFDSGNVAGGDTFSFTFEEPGTYDYFCSIHPGMNGVVIVEE